MDGATIASLVTAATTMALAAATFSSVRSANRAARTAERALEIGLRPVLVPSRLQDLPEKVLWADNRWTKVGGGRVSVEHVDGVVYFVMSLRNVGSGIAVLHGWRPHGERLTAADGHATPEQFRPQTRDLYVPAGDVSFWQGAIRDTEDPDYAGVAKAIEARQTLTIDLLYGDHEGGQRTISRFSANPGGGEDETQWLNSVSRHWNLDRQDPR
jgi:hypothetical protein